MKTDRFFTEEENELLMKQSVKAWDTYEGATIKAADRLESSKINLDNVRDEYKSIAKEMNEQMAEDIEMFRHNLSEMKNWRSDSVLERLTNDENDIDDRKHAIRALAQWLKSCSKETPQELVKIITEGMNSLIEYE